MGSFAQKQNQPQRQTSSNLRLPGASTSSPGHVIHPAMHLQRTPSDEAVPRFSRANADGLEMDSCVTGTDGFAHDFSRIPVYAKTPRAIQTKLTVNAPKDTHEQEARRVAERVTRRPDPQVRCP